MFQKLGDPSQGEASVLAANASQQKGGRGGFTSVVRDARGKAGSGACGWSAHLRGARGAGPQWPRPPRRPGCWAPVASAGPGVLGSNGLSLRRLGMTAASPAALGLRSLRRWVRAPPPPELVQAAPGLTRPKQPQTGAGGRLLCGASSRTSPASDPHPQFSLKHGCKGRAPQTPVSSDSLDLRRPGKSESPPRSSVARGYSIFRRSHSQELSGMRFQWPWFHAGPNPAGHTVAVLWGPPPLVSQGRR